jgi:hypothetical protein
VNKASKKKTKSPIEEKPVKKAQTGEEKKTVEVKPESETEVLKEKKGGNLGSKIKNWVIILLVLSILFSIGTFVLWKIGMDDLAGDKNLLIVVQEKGVAKAGSVYDLRTEEAGSVNVEEFPAITDRGSFFKTASGKQNIDRLVVVKVETLDKLSTAPFIEYNGIRIPSRDVGGYVSGALWDSSLAGDSPPWKFRSDLLSEWVELHGHDILNANYDSQVYRTIFSDYRAGKIIVHPRNTALIILRFIPLEQIFL